MTATRYNAPPSSTLVITVLVPRTSPSRNPYTALSSRQLSGHRAYTQRPATSEKTVSLGIRANTLFAHPLEFSDGPAGYTRRRGLRKAGQEAAKGSSDDAGRHERHAGEPTRGRPEMGRHHAAPGRADPEAAAGLPADDPGAHEHVRAAPEHPGLLPGRAPPAAAQPPAAHPAGHRAGPGAAAHAPAAGPGPAAELPAAVPADAGHLLAAVQHP